MFDIKSAKKAGYTDEDIAKYLSKKYNYDYEDAKKSGKSTEDILNTLIDEDTSNPNDPQTYSVVNQNEMPTQKISDYKDVFDVEGAKKAGYTDEDIAKYLSKKYNFDIQGAKLAGYSGKDIIKYLLNKNVNRNAERNLTYTEDNLPSVPSPKIGQEENLPPVPPPQIQQQNKQQIQDTGAKRTLIFTDTIKENQLPEVPSPNVTPKPKERTNTEAILDFSHSVGSGIIEGVLRPLQAAGILDEDTVKELSNRPDKMNEVENMAFSISNSVMNNLAMIASTSGLSLAAQSIAILGAIAGQEGGIEYQRLRKAGYERAKSALYGLTYAGAEALGGMIGVPRTLRALGSPTVRKVLDMTLGNFMSRVVADGIEMAVDKNTIDKNMTAEDVISRFVYIAETIPIQTMLLGAAFKLTSGTRATIEGYGDRSLADFFRDPNVGDGVKNEVKEKFINMVINDDGVWIPEQENINRAKNNTDINDSFRKIGLDDGEINNINKALANIKITKDDLELLNMKSYNEFKQDQLRLINENRDNQIPATFDMNEIIKRKLADIGENPEKVEEIKKKIIGGDTNGEATGKGAEEEQQNRREVSKNGNEHIQQGRLPEGKQEKESRNDGNSKEQSGETTGNNKNNGSERSPKVLDNGLSNGNTETGNGIKEEKTISEEKPKAEKPEKTNEEPINTEEKPTEEKNLPIEETDNKNNKRKRFRKNIEAIKAIKKYKKGGKLTKSEKEALKEFTGFGSLRDPLKGGKGWEKEKKELDELLTKKEKKRIESSTLSAYYTPQPIVNKTWEAIRKLGFGGGNLLEPSVGKGDFILNAPKKLLNNFNIEAVEKDDITADIAKAILDIPVYKGGYETFTHNKNGYDVIIGNPPFGNFKLMDTTGLKHAYTAHNFFIAKSIDGLKKGGVLAFVVTHNFLDSEVNKAREYAAKHARLLGAVRLNSKTFGSTGTDVATDLIILQKVHDKSQLNAIDWVHTGINEVGAKINSYYLSHPEYIAGEWGLGKGRFSDSTPMMIKSKDNIETINKMIENLTTDIELSRAEKVKPKKQLIEEEPDTFKIENDELKYFYKNQFGDVVSTSEKLTKEEKPKYKLAIELENKARKLYDMDEYTKEERKTIREQANKAYEAFYKKYGRISKANIKKMNNSSFYSILKSLDSKEGKADILKKDLDIITDNKPTKAENDEEAILNSMAYYGEINKNYIGEQLKEDPDKAIERLIKEEKIFYDDINDKLEVPEVYLSGNVKEKYSLTEIERNKKALKAVFPKDKTIEQIKVSLGATWIPKDVVKKFIGKIFDYGWNWDSIKLEYSVLNKTWSVSKIPTSKSATNTGYENPPYWSAKKILLAALNNSTIKVKDSDGNIDKSLSSEANLMVEKMKSEFEQFVLENVEEAKMVEKSFNNNINVFRREKINTKNMVFPGMNSKIKLMPKQKEAVKKALIHNSVLWNHVVGAGKTFTSIATAMEMKRLGKANRTLIVTLKATLNQFVEQAEKLYPNAKIFVPKKEDFVGENRDIMLSKLINNDYDIIIITKEFLTNISVPEEYKEDIKERMLKDLYLELEDHEKDETEKKRILKKIEVVENKINAALKANKNYISLDKLGVDSIIYDEAHKVKNLFYRTKMKNISGLSPEIGSNIAMDFYIKSKYLEAINGKLVMMTGTPITNSLVEVYSFLRYLNEKAINDMGIYTFDDFSNLFVKTSPEIEITYTGRFKEVTRVRGFKNIQELQNLFNQVEHYIGEKELREGLKSIGREKSMPEASTEQVLAEKSEDQKNILNYIAIVAKEIAGRRPKAGQENPLSLMSKARKASLDARLLLNHLSDFEGSKVNKAVEKVYEIYKKYEKEKATQLIFLDLSVPKIVAKKQKEKILKLQDQVINGATEAIRENAAKKLDEIGEEKISMYLFGDTYSVYDDIIEKLIKKGVKEDEITAIHYHDTEAKREKLFNAISKGKVRIVLGSTSKLGTGVNVQERLIAIHNLDTPYTPESLWQREGRIVRQGNMFDNVKIYNYATKQTLDSLMWQMIVQKSKPIEMFNKSEIAGDEIDFDSNFYINAEEMKTSVTDMPEIKEKFELDKKIKQLETKIKIENNVIKIQKSKLENKIKIYENMLQHNMAAKKLKEDFDSFNLFDPKKRNLYIDDEEINNKIDSKKILGISQKIKRKIEKAHNGEDVVWIYKVGERGSQEYLSDDITLQKVSEFNDKWYLKLKDFYNLNTIEFFMLKNPKNPNHYYNTLMMSLRNYYKELEEKTKIDYDKKLEEAVKERDKVLEKSKDLDSTKDELFKMKKKSSELNNIISKKSVVGEDNSKQKILDNLGIETWFSEVAPSEAKIKIDSKSYKRFTNVFDPQDRNEYLHNEKKRYIKDDKIVFADGSDKKLSEATVPTEKNPMREKTIINYINDNFFENKGRKTNRIYLYGIKNRSKNTYTSGLYHPHGDYISLDSFSNIETLAHELGHKISFRSFGKNISLRVMDFKDKFSEELRKFSPFNYKESKTEIEEGFAEFMRAYLTQYNRLKEEEPKLVGIFERAMIEEVGVKDGKRYKIIDKNGEVKTTKAFLKKLKILRNMMHQYYFQTSAAKISSKIAKPVTKYDALRDLLNTGSVLPSLKTMLFDSAHGGKVLEYVLGKKVRGAKSPYELFSFSHHHWQSLYEATIYFGTPKILEHDKMVNIKGKEVKISAGSIVKNGDSLMDIIKDFDAKNGELNDFLMYLLAQDSIDDVIIRGNKTPIEFDSAVDFIEQYKGNYKFERGSERLQKFFHEMLDFQNQCGLITKKTIKEIKSKYPHYLPMMRSIEKSHGVLSGRGSSSKRRYGSNEYEVENILENITDKVQLVIRESLDSLSRKKTIEFIKQSDEGGMFGRPISPSTVMQKINAEDLAEKLVRAFSGMDIIALKMSEADTELAYAKQIGADEVNLNNIMETLLKNPEILEFYSTGGIPTQTGHYITSVYNEDKDKMEYFEFQKGGIAEPLLMTLRYAQAPAPLSHDTFGRIILEPFLTMKRIVTRTITATPNFFVMNIGRDLSNAAIVGQLYNPKHIGSAVKSYFSDDELLKLFYYNGGGYSGFFQTLFNEQNMLKKHAKYRNENKAPQKAINFFDKVLESGEIMSRLSMFLSHIMRIADEGNSVDMIHAVRYTQTTATDFGRKGSSSAVNIILSLSAFTRGSINSLVDLSQKLIENEYGEVKAENIFKNQTRYEKSKAKIFASGLVLTSATLMAFLLGLKDKRQEDQRIEDISKYLTFYLPNGDAIKIPLPFELGAVFSTFPRLLMNRIFHKDGEDMAKAVSYVLINVFLPQYSVTLFSVWNALESNKDYRGRNIVPEALEHVYSEKQSTFYTPEVYKKIGNLFGVSPIKLEHIVNSFGQYYARYFNGVTQSMLWDEKKFGALPKDNSIVGMFTNQFVAPKVPYATIYTNKFWELKDELRKVESTYYAERKNELVKGERQKARDRNFDVHFDNKFFKRHERAKKLFQWRKKFGSISKSINYLNNLSAEIYYSKQLSLPVQKSIKKLTNIEPNNKILSGEEKDSYISAIRQKKNELIEKFVKDWSKK